jgi:hypothetical protein
MNIARRSTWMPCNRASSTLKKNEPLNAMTAPATITVHITAGKPVPTASSRSLRAWITWL